MVVLAPSLTRALRSLDSAQKFTVVEWSDGKGGKPVGQLTAVEL